MSQVLPGDALTVLRTLPDESVQCCVTSPPYWGLRDYGTATWEGGSAECDHKQSVARHDGGRTQIDSFHGSACADSDKGAINYRDTCGKCGATRIDSQLGLEPTPEEYVAKMVEVFREVRRVLRSDGTLWLNMGDSYAGSWGAQSRPNGTNNGSTLTGGSMLSARQIEAHPHLDHGTGSLKNTPGLKPKDLVGIPWRMAFALQADGWYLRSDIIWAKPNPMPESVTDRPTKAHEYLFLLSKSERYFYDADAVREPHSRDWSSERVGPGYMTAQQGRNDGGKRQGNHANVAGRNRRTVWTIATQPYAEAHFATFPEALVEPCILAGSKAGDTVLDPFAGSGTTLAVAKRLDREGIGIELNPAYVKLAEKRIAKSARQIALFSGAA